ncbi:MAG: efflux RND transporter periplasmic adaptor subunit [Crocinitomicaceae bacterium]|nr:efflux RND transporter periplasmic adaptor subunit [Crocinitomicaceae bacterium]
MRSLLLKSALILPALLLLQSCGGGEKEIEVEETYRQLVELGEVEQKKFIHEIRVQGNIETDQDVLLTAEMGGLIISINVKEGQRVSKGQIIAQIDASVLSSNLQELQTQLEYAEYMLEKQEELNKRGVGSEFELEAAKNQVNSLKASMNSLSTQQGKSIIRAPFSGMIDQVFARQGQMAGPSAPVVRLVNNSTVDIVAGVSEMHYAKIKVGTPIRVSFPNYGDVSMLLNVTSVGNYIEPTNRTFRIKSTIKDNDYLLPNMLAEISITDLEVESGLVISSASVLKDQDNHDFVFTAVPFADDSLSANLFIVEKVLVNVIERYNGETLIESGALKVKESIVVGGARGVADGDIVRIKK